MDNFPSNSQRPVKPKSEGKEVKKVEKVIEGEVVRRKKPLSKRFAETFMGGSAKGVWEYVLMDVLIPAAKDTITDAVSQGVERMIFGDSRSPSSRARRSGSSYGYTSYNKMSSTYSSRRDNRREPSHRARSSHDFDEIILSTRVEAEEVIDRLFDLVSKYETASVADLYDLVGVNGSYTDEKWGWTDLRGAGVSRTRSGYLLDLPRPELLD